MSLTVALDCGHQVHLLQTARDQADGPAILYPLDDDNSVDPGDAMTCVVCEETSTVTEVTP